MPHFRQKAASGGKGVLQDGQIRDAELTGERLLPTEIQIAGKNAY